MENFTAWVTKVEAALEAQNETIAHQLARFEAIENNLVKIMAAIIELGHGDALRSKAPNDET